MDKVILAFVLGFIFATIGLLTFQYYYPTLTATHGVREVKPDVAMQKILNKEYDFIVDVRTDDEWNEAHLRFDNVVHIPIGILVTALPAKIPDKNARLLFVCKRGIRAEAANVIATKLGYRNVDYLDRSYTSLLQ
jgi:rhodanese-related sulfurtransferase